MRTKQRRACARRQPFRRAEAKAIAAGRRGLGATSWTLPYHCPACGAYHLGHRTAAR